MISQRFVRQDMTFETSDGTQLKGWYYRPEGLTEPVPAIIMSHGFGAIKEHFAFRFAEVFVKAGLAVLLYDHRGFGESGGLPRQEIDPWQQVNDERDAITWLSLRADVDATRIGIWGTSYSGGHALVLAAIDKRIKCVVAQVPTISGYQQSLRRVRPDEIAAARRNYEADRKARYLGEAPVMRALVPPSPGQPAINYGDDAREFYLSVTDKVPALNWQNAVTLRSTELASAYEPGIYIARIAPIPLLMIVADQDDVTPTDLALDAYRMALEPKQLTIIQGGHFSPYQQKFDQASAAARDWFVKFLVQPR